MNYIELKFPHPRQVLAHRIRDMRYTEPFRASCRKCIRRLVRAGNHSRRSAWRRHNTPRSTRQTATRLPQDHVSLLLKLAGKQLQLNGQAIRLGAPQINLLQPSSALYARIVTIKGYTKPEAFTDAVCRKLNELGIRGEVVVGPRRVLKVGAHTIVGFGLAIHELSDDASMQLQEQGLGGRRKMGCGYFNPITNLPFGKGGNDEAV